MNAGTSVTEWPAPEKGNVCSFSPKRQKRKKGQIHKKSPFEGQWREPLAEVFCYNYDLFSTNSGGRTGSLSQACYENGIFNHPT